MGGATVWVALISVYIGYLLAFVLSLFGAGNDAAASLHVSVAEPYEDMEWLAELIAGLVSAPCTLQLTVESFHGKGRGGAGPFAAAAAAGADTSTVSTGRRTVEIPTLSCRDSDRSSSGGKRAMGEKTSPIIALLLRRRCVNTTPPPPPCACRCREVAGIGVRFVGGRAGGWGRV